jgi:3-oxoacid CoA-transferase
MNGSSHKPVLFIDRNSGGLTFRKFDLAILGAFEVTDSGDIANWMIPGKMIKGPGGAMDLVAGVKRVVAVMEHTSKDGSPKILKKCTLPITGLGVVNLIITDLCVFEVKEGGGLVLTEIHSNATPDDIRAKTGAPFEVALSSSGS